MQLNGYAAGVLMVAVAATLWSLMGVAIRSLDQMGTWQVMFWRSAGMIPVLGIFVWAQSGGNLICKLGGIGLAGIIGAFGLVLAFGGAIFAIQSLPLANAVFLFSASPFLTALLAVMVLGERVRLATWIAVAIAGIGIWRMIGGTSLTDGDMTGNLAALGSALGFSVFTVALRLGKGGEMLPTVILGAVLSMLTAAIVLSLPGETVLSTSHDMALALGMGAVLLGFGMTLFTKGSRIVPAGELAILSQIEVMLAPVWGWVILSEMPEPAILQGGALILLAVMVNALTGTRVQRAHSV